MSRWREAAAASFTWQDAPARRAQNGIAHKAFFRCRDTKLTPPRAFSDARGSVRQNPSAADSERLAKQIHFSEQLQPFQNAALFALISALVVELPRGVGRGLSRVTDLLALSQ